MGCNQSKHKPVSPPKGSRSNAVVPTAASNPNSSKQQASRSRRRSPTKRPPKSSDNRSTQAAPIRKPSSSNGEQAAPITQSISKGPTQPIDDSWASLWETLHEKILDPADVHSVLAGGIAMPTWKLSPTETTFLVRRVRQVVRSMPKPNPSQSTHKIMNRRTNSKPGNNNGERLEGRAVVEKCHQIDETTLKKVFYGGHALLQGVEQVDPLGSTFILAAHLSSEPLWDRTAAIAKDSAERVGLVIDVNKNKKWELPPPSPPTLKDYIHADSADVVGASLLPLTFLVALGLRGTREQRLQLLFYLCMPPQHLATFLLGHPAGGLPTWLLEVGGDTIISTASLIHYYYFGRAFVPSPAKPSPERKKKVAIASTHVIDMLSKLLSRTVVPVRERQEVVAATTNGGEKTAGGPREKQNGRKRSFVGNDAATTNGNGATQVQRVTLPPPRAPTPVMQFLHDVRDGVESVGTPVPVDDLLEGTKKTEGSTWRMDQFVHWAEFALSNEALDTIFHRLYGTGVMPSPYIEKELVEREWKAWQLADYRLWSQSEEDLAGVKYRSRFDEPVLQNGENGIKGKQKSESSSPVWGGLGGFDGKGGLGYGLMYCVEKRWWEAWESYVGWTWGEAATPPGIRPPDLSTENLLDRTSNVAAAGTLGSYEIMKSGLTKGVDYVLVPPSVWDILFELYGGGPPLPRMVLPPPRFTEAIRDRSLSVDSKQMEDGEVEVTLQDDDTVTDEQMAAKPYRIPPTMMVATHPWIIHCNLCDVSQPYRRGDAGSMSIRMMTTPDQPLWRLYAEIVQRIQILNHKAIGKGGRGRARLWRRIDTSGKDAPTRYGPWALLCKGRSAIMPILHLEKELGTNYAALKEDWQAYADHATVEGIGLTNGDRLMLEYAIAKNGEFNWPREAAAKDGRVRRIAEEDSKFKRLLRGVDEKGEPLENPPGLVGMKIDAMTPTGRWYQVEILQEEAASVEEPDDGQDESVDTSKKTDAASTNGKETKKNPTGKRIRIEYPGGQSDWISVESDRLHAAGRCTVDKADDGSATQPTKKTAADAKSKKEAGKKLGIDNGEQNTGKICTFPGYGACGLANLGNTCYANSAIQCISYMPLLRPYLLSAQYRATGDLNKDNPLGTGGKLLEEFAELLRSMWSGKSGERSPRQFRVQLGKQRPQFAGADQQDAQELLNYMLDVLHEDSNKVKKKPYVEALEDDWVLRNTLPRVGEEAWRRFLRRNRSIMADVAMGQVLNTVSCPVCGFSSRNFDPFNLLSIPFPTVAGVVFLCTVVRRTSIANSPKVLNRPKRNDEKQRYALDELEEDRQPPSKFYVQEQYVIAMSRLADIGDLRMRLQNVCGIPSGRLKLCKSEEIVVNKELHDNSPLKRYTKVTALPDKEGPCVHVAKSASSSPDDIGTSPQPPTRIFAFESTLSPRPPGESQNGAKDDAGDDDTTEEDCEEDEKSQNDSRNIRETNLVKQMLRVYGDSKECRIYDTNPLAISKAISRSLWPATENDFKLGLRVDAIDHRHNWFPGSVVEIIEGIDNEKAESSEEAENATKTKVRIHFDRFSFKWDETYTIDHFKKGQVRPLYSHSTPRPKPTEFIVHNRYQDKKTKTTALFGQSFFVQCENEWSTARAGAHILAQASRYLNSTGKEPMMGPVDVDEVQENDTKLQKLYDISHGAVSELIDLLLECDNTYVRDALGVSDGGKSIDANLANPSFDASALSSMLVKKVGALLHKLPFELKVCTSDALMGSKGGASNEEHPYPFSLMRTIGNYMNARHSVVLHWRDPGSEKKSTSKSHPMILYVPPEMGIHKSSQTLLEEGSRKSKNNPGSGGLHLGVCLTEFCKVNQLTLNDGWRCPRCKENREGKQNMNLWRLPDLLTFHIKRFNCSARWREKISTKVNFPLTGLDLSEWCHPESPASVRGPDNCVYDLIAVVNHYGGMTGGHYVATCKATGCGPDGTEEVAFDFNGTSSAGGIVGDDTAEMPGVAPAGLWRRKEKESVGQQRQAAMVASRNVAESAEPLWLQFDDELVEPIPPRNVVSEMAYVLFYRRRRMTTSNIAKYSTLD